MDEQIKAGRNAVDKYRAEHEDLYRLGSATPPDHTPIFESMMKSLNEAGYKTLDDFFVASELSNIKGLGFKDKEDFQCRATKADKKNLADKWC